jgi:hypothetical protein
MRRMIVLGAVCFCATVLLAQSKMTPLNVKAGYWQNTVTTVSTGGVGIPPELAAKLTPAQRSAYEAAMKQQASGTPRTTTNKGCVTQEQLSADPFGKMNRAKNFTCQEHLIRSTGSDLEVEETCTGGSSKSDIHITFHAIDSQHATGQGHVTMTMGGRTMNSNMKMEMKWLGATCPADMQ